MERTVDPYNEEWPAQFSTIKTNLAANLADYGISYISIDHVGSTSVPGLAAKPVIDIHIVVAAVDFHSDNHSRFIDALREGDHQGGYTPKGDGGVKGKWSFKLEGIEPWRNVAVVAEGSMPWRSARSLRDTLKMDAELRDEYGRVKMELIQKEYNSYSGYSIAKNDIIRKILTQGGWSNEEIDEKEASVTVWLPELEINENTLW